MVEANLPYFARFGSPSEIELTRFQDERLYWNLNCVRFGRGKLDLEKIPSIGRTAAVVN